MKSIPELQACAKQKMNNLEVMHVERAPRVRTAVSGAPKNAIILPLTSRRPPEQDADSLAPLVVQTRLNNLDPGVEIADHPLRRRVKSECGTHEVEQRRRLAQLDA